ncbi:MAG TPA: hypothetical protein VHF25_14365 [Nitriliruptorales bacterium]|nr:hypothetical protein [Nitriliruptorales bacterium]
MGAATDFEHLVRGWAERFARDRDLDRADLEQVSGLGARIEGSVLRCIAQGLVIVDDAGTFRLRRDPRDRDLNFLSAAGLESGIPGPSRPTLNWEYFVKVAAYVELVEAGWPTSRLAFQTGANNFVDVLVNRGDGTVPLVVEARWSGDELRRSIAMLGELSYERWRAPMSLDERKFAEWTRGAAAAERLWALAPDHDEVYDIDHLHRVPRLVPGGRIPTPS